MPNSPPAVGQPPVRNPIVGGDGRASAELSIWLTQVFNRIGGANGTPIVGDLVTFETTVAYTDLASAAQAALITVAGRAQWKVRDILLSGGGTNFSGGDRLLSITDGTSVWSAVPAATMQALAFSKWGDTGTPAPATAAHATTASAAGTTIYAQYSGGTTDYTAGSLTLVITAEKVA